MLPALSICLGIKRGANSITLVSDRFKSIKALAASSPNKPPPSTAAVAAVAA
ncbi:hypothetical protein D3C86_1912350 [compost metagenome]